MELKEKIMMLEEMLDLEDGVLTPETVLSEIEDWDSIAHLSLTIMLGDEFNKEVSGNEVRNLKTVADILSLME